MNVDSILSDSKFADVFERGKATVHCTSACSSDERNDSQDTPSIPYTVQWRQINFKIEEFHPRKHTVNMAKQVFESLDLVRNIYSFGDPSHRVFTESLKWDLKAWPDVLFERYMDRRLLDHSSYSFNEDLY